jgi:replicative DNA helicase
MSAEQLMLRIISMESRIPIYNLKKGTITKRQLEEVEKVVDKINELPFLIHDASILSISELRTELRRMKRKDKISCAFVDYLQLLKSGGASENRTQQITEITQGLKAIAKELDIPIVALSQLSREVEKRDDRIPQLSDLRESGSIEQDADIVVFIYREAYYLDRQKPDVGTPQFDRWQQKMENVANEVDLIVAKHRNGSTGFKKLSFDRNTTTFGDYKK